nr:transposon TX1 [Tanacetum cinerariifolium]
EKLFQKIASIHESVVALLNYGLEGNQNVIFGRVHIHTFNEGLIKEDLFVRLQGKEYKVDVMEEIHDITILDILETRKDDREGKDVDEGDYKLDDNNMQVDKNDKEKVEGEVNDDDESSDEEEGQVGKKEEDGRHSLVMVTSGQNV